MCIRFMEGLFDVDAMLRPLAWLVRPLVGGERALVFGRECEVGGIGGRV